MRHEVGYNCPFLDGRLGIKEGGWQYGKWACIINYAFISYKTEAAFRSHLSGQLGRSLLGDDSKIRRKKWDLFAALKYAELTRPNPA
jgi:hypothetical protein